MVRSNIIGDILRSILVTPILWILFLPSAIGIADSDDVTNWLFSVNDEEVLWFSSESPDGGHEISVTLDGTPYTFGAQHIKVYGDDQLLFNDEIANDGKMVNENNYSIEWDENVATLSFSGEEQKTAVYSVDFSGEEIITKTVVNKWSSIPNDAAAAID